MQNNHTFISESYTLAPMLLERQEKVLFAFFINPQNDKKISPRNEVQHCCLARSMDQKGKLSACLQGIRNPLDYSGPQNLEEW